MLGGGGSWVGSSSGSSGVNKYVRTTRFEIISSGTSGTVTLPSDSTVVLDDFGGTTDAVISKVSSGRPTFEAAVTSGGSIVATTFDSSGNFTLTSTPDSYPVAIIYRVQQFYNDFDDTSSNIIGDIYFQAVASIANTSTTGLISSADWNSFNNKQDAIGYTPEDQANKSTSVASDQASDVKFPSVKSVYDWAVGLFQPIITGAATTVTSSNLATSRAVCTDGSGKLGVATTTYAEMNQLSGCTSNVQNQFNFSTQGIEVQRGYVFQGNATTTVLALSVAAGTVQGTAANASPASTNTRTRQNRMTISASVPAAGSQCGYRYANNGGWWIGQGFRFKAGFGISDAAYSSGARIFVGITNTTTLMPVSDTGTVLALLNCVGIGADDVATDPYLCIVHNDNAGNATKVSLGANFPSNRTSGAVSPDWFTIEFYNPIGSTAIYYKAVNINVANSAVYGAITTNLPANTVPFGFQAIRTSGVSSNQVNIDLSYMMLNNLC